MFNWRYYHNQLEKSKIIVRGQLLYWFYYYIYSTLFYLCRAYPIVCLLVGMWYLANMQHHLLNIWQLISTVTHPYDGIHSHIINWGHFQGTCLGNSRCSEIEAGVGGLWFCFCCCCCCFWLSSRKFSFRPCWLLAINKNFVADKTKV